MTAAGGGTSASWEDAASYEAFMGRWSRGVARRFVDWARLPTNGEFLDVGCGTGAVSEALARSGAKRVLGIDPSPRYVEHASASVSRHYPQTAFEQGDAMKLPYPNDSFDAAVSGLVLNFVPDPRTAVGEMRRVVRPGGIVAAYVWDYAGRMELLRRFWDAAVALDPSAAILDEGVRFPICNPKALWATFRDASLLDAKTARLDEPVVFREFDDYWRPFLGGQGPCGAYAMGLSEDRRARLRERLRSDLRTKPDGSIPMVLRAWVVRGVKE